MVHHWDVFHSDRLEVERGLSREEVKAALARGDLRDDDLVRLSGTTDPWARFVDRPDLFADEFEASGLELVDEPDAPYTPTRDDGAGEPSLEVEILDDDDDDIPYGEFDLNLRGGAGVGPPPEPEVEQWEGEDAEAYDPQEEDEEAAEFTLARGSAETVEELDLAAMVDVAFQLVLFFLVTATTVLFKSLEVPKPNPESPPPVAAAQGQPSRTLDDLKDAYIVVEIDPAGSVKIDNEPVPGELPALVERLRTSRDRTGRKSMLLSADFSTPHRSAVLAYDAANEIGLGIAIARPKPPAGAGGP